MLLYNIFPKVYWVIHYQTDKLAGCVEGTETTRSPIGMQGRKCHSCELWYKEEKKKNRNNNTLKRHRSNFIERVYYNRRVRRGRSHPPQCTTSREYRQIVRMAVTDCSVTSRTVVQHIESVMHHSVSAHTIRRCLQQSGLSARRPLLGLPLTQNHRRLRHQWCDERGMWVAEWNEVVFTDESCIYLQHHDGRIRVWIHR
ncbi:transposable element Tcb1 transposase [Trichonephila clavipes]|nr:transposable element Tcb1 transposase [Trichonephila clavipes]